MPKAAIGLCAVFLTGPSMGHDTAAAIKRGPSAICRKPRIAHPASVARRIARSTDRSGRTTDDAV
jgi:hypothetical protein